MKKALSILLSFVMLLTFMVFAEQPSKTVADLLEFEIEGSSGDNHFFIKADKDQTTAEYELSKLEEQGLEVYFYQVFSDVSTYVEKSQWEAVEFVKIIAGNYEDEMGDVLVHITFPTPLAKDQKAAILIGLMNGENYDWRCLEGIGNNESGADVTMPGIICKAIEEQGALLALVV